MIGYMEKDGNGIYNVTAEDAVARVKNYIDSPELSMNADTKNFLNTILSDIDSRSSKGGFRLEYSIDIYKNPRVVLNDATNALRNRGFSVFTNKKFFWSNLDFIVSWDVDTRKKGEL